MQELIVSLSLYLCDSKDRQLSSCIFVALMMIFRLLAYNHSTATPSLKPVEVPLLTYGTMEGDVSQVEYAWVPSCPGTMKVSNDVFYEGSASLAVSSRSSSACVVIYYIGPGCDFTDGEDLKDGDTIHISFRIRSPEVGAIVEVRTNHRSVAKGNWKPPDDDSHMVIRSKIHSANEWTFIEASHLIGPSWRYNGELYPPDSCRDFQLLFSLPESTADFYLDDVRMSREASLPESSISVAGGIMQNPKFDLGTSFWSANNNKGGYVTYDEELGHNALVLRQNDQLFQNIQTSLVSGSAAQLSFWVKLTGIESFDVSMEIFLKFINNDIVNGPCQAYICKLYIYPIEATISTPGKWHQLRTDAFSIWDFDSWDGQILSTTLTINGPVIAGSSVSFANFGELKCFCS